MIGRPKLVLASGSPRRVTLINQAGIEPDALRPANVDETPRRGELPRACANRLARAKAEAALELVRADEELQGAYILAADTVVAVGRRILPKAELLDEAAQCLRLLSGRNHRVHTAICLVTPNEAYRQRLVETRVLRRLAQQTGGRAFFPNQVADLANVYGQISDELSSQYTVGYYPTNTSKDGRFRKVKVETANKDYRILTRKGYYAPKS